MNSYNFLLQNDGEQQPPLAPADGDLDNLKDDDNALMELFMKYNVNLNDE